MAKSKAGGLDQAAHHGNGRRVTSVERERTNGDRSESKEKHSVLIKQAEALLVAQQPAASRPFILGLWSLGRIKPRVLLAVSLTCPRGRGQWLYRSLPRFTRLKRCTPLARLSTSFSHFSTMGDTSLQMRTAAELSPPTASIEANVYPTGTLFPNVSELHTEGGTFASIGGNVYNDNRTVNVGCDQSNITPSEAPKVDVMAILKTVSNYRKIQQDTFSKATPKTGEWMLKHEKIAAWQDPKSSLDMMCGSGIRASAYVCYSWCWKDCPLVRLFSASQEGWYADPVAARSIMINHAEERARELGSPVCIGFIYLRCSDNAGLTVRHCFEVLVKQSLQQHPNLLRLAEEVYAPHVRLEGEPPEGELLRLLQGFTRAVTSTTYFLDALDEAPPAIQIDLVGKLASTGAKLFITSRPFKALEERFPNAHHFSIAAQDSDLELHINSQLDEYIREGWGGIKIKSGIRINKGVVEKKKVVLEQKRVIG
ncbi:hypothetical protein BKA70DRAFT_1466413 [Coprinopsis sp. MPI-PUGE-AT-0042]|nr:hypothetical protein BKA70DRAFT_1466413 [Coprinopsis sp. MPI-PUGE-AT-0042]